MISGKGEYIDNIKSILGKKILGVLYIEYGDDSNSRLVFELDKGNVTLEFYSQKPIRATSRAGESLQAQEEKLNEESEDKREINSFIVRYDSRNKVKK